MNRTAIVYIISLILMIAIASVVGLVYYNEMESRSTIEFFHEYTIATNYIDSAIQTQKIAEINYGHYVDYTTQDEGYYYEDASDYLDSTISELDESLEQLERSELILLRIKPNTPTEFYDTEVQIRLDQVSILKILSEKRTKMIELSNDELYEINYGSESKADELFEEINLLIESFNEDLITSFDADKQIDIHWGENFYPN